MSESSRRYTVDIDIGGTLTDGLFSDGEQTWVAKVDTTPHDFTVCFFDCLREGASLTGHEDLTSFLQQVAVIRWSSTIATNVLAEEKGPRLGLLVSPGHEEDLYDGEKSPAIGHLISPENIATVQDPTNHDEVLMTIRSLLEQGARRICVSLEGASRDNSGELAIKQLVEEQFPDHYLGSVPTLLGSEIGGGHPDDRTRTHMALINAYVHTPLAMALFRAEDDLLSEHEYRRPLYIGHVNGGVARVSKTKGVDTTESGPVFGLVASAYFARRHELDKVISLDVGGTTKVGMIVDGEAVMTPKTDFFGIPLEVPWTLLRSAALGGGSVARISGGQVALGPDSMGAYPGPACYDLGGDNATLTDAFLVAGMLNPDGFLGGKRQLKVELTREALDEHVQEALSEARSANGGVVERVAVRGVSPAPRVDLTASDEQRYEAEPYGQCTVLGEQAGL